MTSWEFPPRVLGGLGRHVGELVPALRSLGHDVRVVAPDSTDLGGDLLAHVAAGQAELIRAGRNAVDGWTPDVVHGHDWLTAVAARELARHTRAPLVTTMHATERGRQQGYLTSPLQRQIDASERRLCLDSDVVLACSQYQADELDRLFHVPATVIGNGCTLTFNPKPKDANLIAFAGRLVHEKGVQELIKALPLLSEEFPDIHCVIAGDGPLYADQLDRAERYGVADRIRWAGFLDQRATTDLLAHAAVVVVPSLYEPFGLVALEAQAVGTPVAVSDVGGLRELVTDGITGVRFEPESPAAIATAIRRLLRDPKNATAMAKTARQKAETDFSWTAVAQRVAAAYPR